jgi:hypothetical protein
MVWGAIGLGFRGPLVRCPPSVNQESYRRILAESQIFATLTDRFGRDGFWWQQDNAPPASTDPKGIGQGLQSFELAPIQPRSIPYRTYVGHREKKIEGKTVCRWR